MNVPPTDGITVAFDVLRHLVEAIFCSVPIPQEHARLVAELLLDTELRGVVSHGVGNVERYVRSYQDGKINPNPQVSILRDGPATGAFSGDGGLGMIVGAEAMRAAVHKARQTGIGVTTSTSHAHIGSAGKYVRMALREKLIGITYSGRNTAPVYDHTQSIHRMVQGSPPLAFGFPAGQGRPAFLLDFGSNIQWDVECFKKLPEIYIRCIGLSQVANILSGTLGGQMLPQFDRRTIRFKAADQSAFFLVLDVDRFTPLDSFCSDVDRLMEEASRMTPFPGFNQSSLPGGRAWQKEQQYLAHGIPISAAAMTSLTGLAHEFGLAVPWE